MVIFLASTLVSIAYTEIVNGSVERELFARESKSQILYRMFEKKCPSYIKTRKKGTSSILSTRLRVEKAYYSQLERILAECLNDKAGTRKPTDSMFSNIISVAHSLI